MEWEVRKGDQRSFGKEVMKGSSPRVPQQDNFSDCGVYVLQYVESFFQVTSRLLLPIIIIIIITTVITSVILVFFYLMLKKSLCEEPHV